jgi:hypothetical protein
LNKLLVGTLLAFACISSYADDLKVADDFKSGDLVSADTFNQIFDTLEQINRTVVDADLIGVWKCSSLVWGTSSPGETGWTKKGFAYLMENAQLNFSASSADASIEAPYTFTTSAPSPFIQWSSGDTNVGSASSGTYILHKGMALFYGISFENVFAYSVDIISDSRVILRNTRGTNQAGILVCDSAEAVPASPTSPSATNNKTGINLAWTDASSDETGFKVYRKLSTETEAKVIATQTAVTYSDTDLTEGQTAYYKVVAYNDNGESAKSKQVSATADFTAPTIIDVTPVVGTTLSGPGNGYVALLLNFSETIETTRRKGFSGSLVSMKVNGVATLSAGFTVLNAGSELLVSSLSASVEYQASSTYELTVNKGWVTDANGIGMEADYTWSFSTP